MIAIDDNPVENVAQLSWIIGESADCRMALLSLISGSDLLIQDPIVVAVEWWFDVRRMCQLLEL